MLKKLFLFVATTLLSISFLSCGDAPEQQDKTTPKSTAEYQGCNSVITEQPYNLPAQRFDVTAQQLAHNSGCFIETDLSETGSIQVRPVKGKISIREAVEMALNDTPLEITEESPERIVVELADSAE